MKKFTNYSGVPEKNLEKIQECEYAIKKVLLEVGVKSVKEVLYLLEHIEDVN